MGNCSISQFSRDHIRTALSRISEMDAVNRLAGDCDSNYFDSTLCKANKIPKGNDGVTTPYERDTEAA